MSIVVIVILVIYFKKNPHKLSKIYFKLKGSIFSDGSHLPKSYHEVNFFRNIPCKEDVFRFYYLNKIMGKVDLIALKAGLLSAIILQWVQKGNVSIQESENIITRIAGSGKQRYKLKLHLKSSLENEWERLLFHFFRQAADEVGVVTQSSFEQWYINNPMLLEEWFNQVDQGVVKQLIDDGDCTVTRNKGLFGVSKKVYSQSLKEEMIQIMGFHKFIKEFSLVDQKSVSLWEKYLIFALPIRLADRVEKEITKIYPEFDTHSQLRGISIAAFDTLFISSSIVQIRKNKN